MKPIPDSAREQIISDITNELASAGITIHKPYITLPWGIQIKISSEGKSDRKEYSYLNIYFGKKGPSITLQGKESDRLKKIIPLITKKVTTKIAPPGESSLKKNRDIPIPLISSKKYIGADESGKGDYFGSLVVAAFISDTATDKKLVESGVRDSKKLSNTSCLRIYEKIKNIQFRLPSVKAGALFSILEIPPEKYNREYLYEKNRGGNLNTLLHRLHMENILALTKKIKSYGREDTAPEPMPVIIDDFLNTAKSAVITNNTTRSLFTQEEDDISTVKPEQEIRNTIKTDIYFIPSAEDKYPAVAAASVIARAEYLKSLKRLSQRYFKGNDIELSGGSGYKTSSILREIIRKYGKDILPFVAKTSFKIS